jgi:hypothetical protein
VILTLTIVFVAAGIAAIPYSTGQYEDLGANCWLAAQGEYDTRVKWGIVMRFATHYGVIWSVCIFCAWCYITIFRYVQEVREALRQSALSVTNERSEVERTVYRLQYYPGPSLILLLRAFLSLAHITPSLNFFSNPHLLLVGNHCLSLLFIALS